MTERQYTDDEVAAIFERASKTEPTAVAIPAEGKGMTLAALQEIGREVGISPESISQAARSLELARRPASLTLMGLPIGVGQTVEFDRPLSDSDWERLVGDLRVTFESRGAVRYDGPFRQWTNGNLQALVEPTSTGHRLRLQTVNGAAGAMMKAGMITLGVAAFYALALAGGFNNAGSVVDAVFIVAMGLGMFAGGALRLPGWARRRQSQIEAVAARLVIAANSPRQDDPRPGPDPQRPT